MKSIKIHAGSVEMDAELNDNPTSKLVWNALPIEGRANRWGDEIYFAIPVKAISEQSAREDVEVGELGYWPPGNAFCIFFGPTPVSSGTTARRQSGKSHRACIRGRHPVPSGAGWGEGSHRPRGRYPLDEKQGTPNGVPCWLHRFSSAEKR